MVSGLSDKDLIIAAEVAHIALQNKAMYEEVVSRMDITDEEMDEVHQHLKTFLGEE